MTKIYWDLGHGGTDPGAVGNGLQEKNVVLAIGKQIEELMKGYEGVEWKFSRLIDRTLSLPQRTDDANKWGADALVSIHINAGGGVGFESFIYNGNYIGASESKNVALQNVVHKNIMAKTPFFRDRGKKRANFHMVRESKMIAVLTECGFIDNKGDSDSLKNASRIKAIAEGHVLGIVEFFGLKKKAAPKPVQPKGTWRVVTGSFQDKSNAEQRQKDLKAKGFDSFLLFDQN